MWLNQPKLFGWFHILGIILAIGFGYLGVLIGRKFKAKDNEKKTKMVLWIIEITFVVLETVKEVYYAIASNGYRWDLFPMQICSVIFFAIPVALVCKEGFVKDSLLGFIGICSFAGAIFYFVNPAAAVNQKYIILSLHSFSWHWLMILTGTFTIVSYDLIKKDKKSMLFGSYAIWIFFAIVSAVVNHICHEVAPELNIDYYHIGYVKVIYPVLSLIFKYPEPYLLFFFVFIVYYALGVITIYYSILGVNKLNHKIFKKSEDHLTYEN